MACDRASVCDMRTTAKRLVSVAAHVTLAATVVLSTYVAGTYTYVRATQAQCESEDSNNCLWLSGSPDGTSFMAIAVGPVAVLRYANGDITITENGYWND